MQTQKAKKKKQNLNPAFFNNQTSRRVSLARSLTYYSSSFLITLNNIFLFLFILLLPTQLGKHFFFDFSFISGVRIDYLAPTIYLTDILALLLILLNLKSIIRFFADKKKLFLLLLFLVNFLAAENKYISLYRYIKIFELAAIFYIFKQMNLIKSKSIFLYGFLIGGVFELLLSLMQFADKHSLQGLFYFFGERPLSLSMPGIAKASLNGVEILRPYGTFSHPNSLAGFYLLVYFFILTYKKIPNSLLKKTLLFICTLLIFLSFSKITIVTYILLNFIYFWRSPLKKTCKLCLISRMSVLSIVSLVFLQAATDPFTLQKRLLLMQNALQIIARHPLFGVGLGNYLFAQGQFPSRYADFLNQPVHNIFLLLTSEVGIVIMAAVCILFSKDIKTAFKKSPYIFIAILITGLFDHYWITLQQNFLLLGVILAL